MLKLTLHKNDAPAYRSATIEFPAIEGALQQLAGRCVNGSFTDYGYIAYRGTTPAVERLLHQDDAPSITMGGI